MIPLSTALNVVVVAACVIAAARLLPRVCLGDGAAPPPFGTTAFVAVVVATVLAAAASHVVGGFVAEALVALLIPRGAHAVFASPDAGEQLAAEGAFLVFALLAATLAVAAIARGFTPRRDIIARFAVAAFIGEAALTCAILALMRPLWARMMTMSLDDRGDPGVPAAAPLVDVVTVVADTVGSLVVFAVVGAIAGVTAGVVFTVVGAGPLRTRGARERRALLVAACVSAPAALVLGGLASPTPDLVSQILAAVAIAAAWLVAVGVGRGAAALARRP